MQSLDTSDVTQRLMDPDNTLNLMLGSDEKVTNWCPAGTVEVELYGDNTIAKHTFHSAEDISSLCEIMVGSFNNDGIDEKTYAQRLVAKAGNGDVKVLEQIPEKPIFRVQGLPFRSPMLLKNIANRASP